MFNTEQPEFKLLRDIIAENTSQLVVWIGAGLSAPAGIPTWRQLKAILEKSARDKAKTLIPEGKRRIFEKINHSKKLVTFG